MSLLSHTRRILFKDAAKMFVCSHFCRIFAAFDEPRFFTVCLSIDPPEATLIGGDISKDKIQKKNTDYIRIPGYVSAYTGEISLGWVGVRVGDD